jgi:hypothetical protein
MRSVPGKQDPTWDKAFYPWLALLCNPIPKTK